MVVYVLYLASTPILAPSFLQKAQKLDISQAPRVLFVVCEHQPCAVQMLKALPLSHFTSHEEAFPSREGQVLSRERVGGLEGWDGGGSVTCLGLWG